MEQQKFVIEHLIRLAVVLKISHYTGNNAEGKEFINILEQLTEDIKNIYQIERDHLLIYEIGDCISIKEKGSIATILQSSKKYIEENRAGLDVHTTDKLLSEISKYIYKLKFL